MGAAMRVSSDSTKLQMRLNYKTEHGPIGLGLSWTVRRVGSIWQTAQHLQPGLGDEARTRFLSGKIE